jgi:tetratricopeptide (TPR) repeat protein
MTLGEQFDSAYSHHQAGRLDRAEPLYRGVLAQQPDHVEALHLLGTLALQTGRFEMAADMIRQAVQLRPDSAEAHYNLSLALKNIGQYEEAIVASQRAIRLRPDLTDAYLNLGNALISARRLDEAIAAFKQAISLRPSYAEAYANLGNALTEKGCLDEAIAAFSKASEQRPGWAVPILSIGKLFHEHGRFEEALLAFQKATEAEPNSAEAFSFSAIALAELQRFDEAAIALERATALSPESALTHEARGMIKWRSGQGTEAVQSFRRAVEISPESLSAWIKLGQTLRHIGRFDEVTDCVRQILVRRPGAVQAYALMASIGATPGAPDAARELESLDEQKMSIGDRAALGFAVGKMLDESDRFDEAFDKYSQANSLMLQMRHAAGERYSSDLFARRVDDLIAMMTPRFFERTRDWGEPSELPVFIVGMPRSGTSLVEQIASSHPQVFGAGELREIGKIETSLASNEWQSCAIKQAARNHLNRLRALGGSASRVIDKMPANVGHLGLIATLFSSARVIICRRDPRDACLSCFFQHFTTGNLFSFELRQCGRHHVHIDRLIAHWLKVLPMQMLQVQYEDLVKDLEEQSRRIISFLDLPWNPACLDFHRTQRTVQTSSAWQVRQPIYTRSVGRWRNYEKYLGPLFESLGLEK